MKLGPCISAETGKLTTKVTLKFNYFLPGMFAEAGRLLSTSLYNDQTGRESGRGGGGKAGGSEEGSSPESSISYKDKAG